MEKIWGRNVRVSTELLNFSDFSICDQASSLVREELFFWLWLEAEEALRSVCSQTSKAFDWNSFLLQLRLIEELDKILSPASHRASREIYIRNTNHLYLWRRIFVLWHISFSLTSSWPNIYLHIVVQFIKLRDDYYQYL